VIFTPAQQNGSIAASQWVDIGRESKRYPVVLLAVSQASRHH
jgi:hypothetical protein